MRDTKQTKSCSSRRQTRHGGKPLCIVFPPSALPGKAPTAPCAMCLCRLDACGDLLFLAHLHEFCASIGTASSGFIMWQVQGEMLGVAARGSAAICLVLARRGCHKLAVMGCVWLAAPCTCGKCGSGRVCVCVWGGGILGTLPLPLVSKVLYVEHHFLKGGNSYLLPGCLDIGPTR